MMMNEQKSESAKRRRGRRPAPRAEARVHRVACRLTDDEVAKVDALRGKNSRGAWLRLSAFARAPRPIPQVNIEKWAELARLHSNLNQLNRHANEQNQGLAGAHLDQLRRMVPDLFLAVADLRGDLIGQPAASEIDESSC